MGLILKKGASIEEIETLRKKIKKRVEATYRRAQNKRIEKGFNAQKHNGVIELKENPIELQRKWRDEWERDFS